MSLEHEEWPEGMEMIRQLRQAVGLPSGALPISPKQAWEEAIAAVIEATRVYRAHLGCFTVTDEEVEAACNVRPPDIDPGESEGHRFERWMSEALEAAARVRSETETP